MGKDDEMEKSKGNMSVDLHIHTLDSDGLYSVEDVLKKILAANIEVFSITDHETMKSYETIKSFVDRYRLTWIPGVEITVNYNGKKHILAYGVDPYHEDLQKLMTENRRLVVNKLDTDSLGFPNVESVIAAIKKANGIAILAHPGCRIYPEEPKCLIDAMIKLGIDGIECYHPDNDPELTEYCLRICKEKDLYITGGSDYHGKADERRELNSMLLSLDMLDLPRFDK